MSWTDEEIDKLFRNAADKHSIPYDPSYWKEFELSIPSVRDALSDEDIDALFRNAAKDHAVEYDASYWKEFEGMLPPVDVSWADAEIDDLFRSEATEQSFAYDEAYWKEFEKMLPGERKRDVLWFFFAFTSISILGVMMMNKAPVSATTGTQDLNQDKALMVEQGFTRPTENGITDSDNAGDQQAAYHVDREEINTVAGAPRDADRITDHPENPGDQLHQAHEPMEETKTLTEPLTGEEGDRSETAKDASAAGNETATGDAGSEENQSFVPTAPERLGLNEAASLSGLPEAVPLTGIYPKMPGKIFTSLYLQGVGGLSQSLITPSESVSKSYGLGFGIKLTRGHLSVNTGINAILSQHDDIELNRSAKVYGFGSTMYKYQLDYQHLYLLEGDFSVAYTFRRSSFRMGIRPSYLLSTRVRIEQSDVIANESLTENSESRVAYGFNEGVRKFGVKPTIGYSYLLASRSLEFGANFGVQLMPMVNEDFINGKNNTLPVDGQLYIRKYIHLRR